MHSLIRSDAGSKQPLSRVSARDRIRWLRMTPCEPLVAEWENSSTTEFEKVDERPMDASFANRMLPGLRSTAYIDARFAAAAATGDAEGDSSLDHSIVIIAGANSRNITMKSSSERQSRAWYALAPPSRDPASGVTKPTNPINGHMYGLSILL